MREAKSNRWKKTKASIFWGEIAPCDHVVQIYESDPVFLEALTGFSIEGIKAGDSVIIIATQEHLNGLKAKLTDAGIDIHEAIADDRFIGLDAEATLAAFMIDGWPDEKLFHKVVSKIIKQARGRQNRKVRAFGEMVALLWAQGNNGATVQLEHLWNDFCASEPFSLFCAYPRSGFTQNILESIEHICCTHTKMIAGSERQLTDVIYREVAVG